MINLYYTPSSGSVSSSLYIYSDSTIITPSIYNNVILEITASGYDTSGSYSGTVGTLRVYIKSGSIEYASFPIEETNIFYSSPFISNTINTDPYPSTSASFNVNYSFYPSPFITSSNEVFIITGSSLLSGSSTNIALSQSYNAGTVGLLQGDIYTVILSGSGQFYNSSISIINTSTSTTASYVTGSNSYISASFSSSNYYNYSIEATTNRTSNIKLTFASIADIPVSPTESLGGWNTYLNVYADSIINSGSTVYLLGGNLSTITSLAVSSSKVTDFNSYGLNSLTNLYIARPTEPTGSLRSFPSLDGVSNIVTLNLSYNGITGSIPTSYSSSYYLQEFSCSRNKISGSIQSIVTTFSPTQSSQLIPIPLTININHNNITGSIPPLSSSRVTYLDCSYNKLSGSISSLSGSYGLQYLNCGGNALTGSIPTLSNAISLQYFDCSSNKLSGSIPELSSSYTLQTFNCSTNYLTGSLPIFTTSSYNLTYFNCEDNRISGSIPNLSSSYIQTFNCSINKLTGSIDISGSSTLTYFECGTNQLSGSINSLEGCTNLTYFSYGSNHITGDIPRLTNAPVLEEFWCASNGGVQDYIYITDILPSTLLQFQAYDSGIFKPSAIDGILYGLDAAGGVSGSVNLSGPSNASPTATGYSYSSSLASKAWTVLVN
jgi:Leucine-rich repeat (LRR) protein